MILKKVNYQSINVREIFRNQLLSWPSIVQFTNVTRLFSNLLGSFSRATKLWFLSKRANSLKAKNWEHMHWTEVKVCTIHGISNLNLTETNFLACFVKVRTFKETHKIWKNLAHGFDKSADLLTLTSLIKGHARLEKSPAYPLIFM